MPLCSGGREERSFRANFAVSNLTFWGLLSTSPLRFPWQGDGGISLHAAAAGGWRCL